MEISDRPCGVCGGPIEGFHHMGNRKYCSDRCERVVLNRRQRDRLKHQRDENRALKQQVKDLEDRLREVCHEAGILLAACGHGNLEVDPSMEMALAPTMDALHRLIDQERGRTDG